MHIHTAQPEPMARAGQVVQHWALLGERGRGHIEEAIRLLIYKAMILPYFDYADIIYDKANQGELDKLQRVQNRCLKICMLTNIKTDTDFVHSHTKVPKLENRRKVHLRNFMFQRKSNDQLLDTIPVNMKARDAPLFKTEFPRYEAYKRSVLYNGATEWNSLPVDVRNIDQFLPFKFMQKKWLISTVD